MQNRYNFMIGTWQADPAYWPSSDMRQLKTAYDYAIEIGCGVFDTADVYAKGGAEMLLARCMRGRREKVFVADKVFATRLRYDSVIKSCEKSLRRLATDYIDLYQVHWPAGSFKTPEVPIAETMAALLELQSQGKIINIGVCNFNVAQLNAALEHVRLYSVQLPHNLLWHGISSQMYRLCNSTDIKLLAYSPLAQGFLAGKNIDKLSPIDHRRKYICFNPEYYDSYILSYNALASYATAIGYSVLELALSWLYAQNIVPVLGISSRNQLSRIIDSTHELLDVAELNDLLQTVLVIKDFSVHSQQYCSA